MPLHVGAKERVRIGVTQRSSFVAEQPLILVVAMVVGRSQSLLVTFTIPEVAHPGARA